MIADASVSSWLDHKHCNQCLVSKITLVMGLDCGSKLFDHCPVSFTVNLQATLVVSFDSSSYILIS